MEQIKTLVEVSNNLNERTKEVEKRINELTVSSEKSKEESKIMNEKMDVMEKNMEKFIGLYEVVTNQYNPFLESGEGSSEQPQQEQQPVQAPAAQTAQQPSQQSASTAEEEEEVSAPVVQKVPLSQPLPQSQQWQQPQQFNQASQQPVAQNAQQPWNNPASPANMPTQNSASFAFEDRITGESGYVGQNGKPKQFNQASQSQQPQQQAPQQSSWQQPSQQVPQQSWQQPQQPFNQLPPQQQQQQFHGFNQGYMNPDQRFPSSLITPTNKTVNTLQDLLEELAIMDDRSFSILAHGQQNDIANWVMNALGNLELGTELLRCTTRADTIRTLSRYIHNRPAEQQMTTDFRFSNGKSVNDIEGMMDELIYVDDNTFAYHVNPQKNDIADWLQSSLKKHDLANKIRPLHKKTDVIRELAMFLHTQN